MELSPGWFTVALGAVGLILVHMLRTPKEDRQDYETRNREAHTEHRKRMELIESNHDALALRFEGTFNRMDEAIRTLSRAIDRLTDRQDGNGARRPR